MNRVSSGLLAVASAALAYTSPAQAQGLPLPSGAPLGTNAGAHPGMQRSNVLPARVPRPPGPPLPGIAGDARCTLSSDLGQVRLDSRLETEVPGRAPQLLRHYSGTLRVACGRPMSRLGLRFRASTPLFDLAVPHGFGSLARAGGGRTFIYYTVQLGNATVNGRRAALSSNSNPADAFLLPDPDGSASVFMENPDATTSAGTHLNVPISIDLYAVPRTLDERRISADQINLDGALHYEVIEPPRPIFSM